MGSPAAGVFSFLLGRAFFYVTVMMKYKNTYPDELPALLELLRCGLWNRQPDPFLFRNVNARQWYALLLLSQQQGVTALVAESLLRLPEDCQPPAEVRLQWFGYHHAVLHQHSLYQSARQEVLSWFESAGIRCAVFKGDTLNSLYPVPGLRMNGDVDLWFPDPDGVQRAHRLLADRGLDITDPGNHHHLLQYNGLSFELHHDFLNLPMSSRVPRDLIFVHTPEFRGWQLNPEANTVMILTHAAHHFIETGLGLRHVCDWAVWLHRYGHTPEVQRGLAEIRRLGAGVFLTEFTALAVYLLGLELPDNDPLIRKSRPVRRERMLCELLLQGNLGKSHLAEKKHTSLPLFYLRSFLRELSLSAFWPRYVVACIPHQIRRSWRMLRKK